MQRRNNKETDRHCEGEGLPMNSTHQDYGAVGHHTGPEADEDSEVPKTNVFQGRWSGGVADCQEGAESGQAQNHVVEPGGDHRPCVEGEPPHSAKHGKYLQDCGRDQSVDQSSVAGVVLRVDAAPEVDIGVHEIGRALDRNNRQHKHERRGVARKADAKQAPQNREQHELRRDRCREAPGPQCCHEAFEEGRLRGRCRHLVLRHLLHHRQRPYNCDILEDVHGAVALLR
mmetsp:Transcript_95593/g.276104  ORF Transcript_95593/g.276104 Transcript_95593/m.276104 type:complete len:229 (+) Transcript_95593:507-1193(+)